MCFVILYYFEINNIKREIHDITQPWYADNAGYLGTFARIDTYFDLITLQGLGRRYYPKPPNSMLIVHPENLESGYSLRHVMDLRCAHAHVILRVT